MAMRGVSSQGHSARRSLLLSHSVRRTLRLFYKRLVGLSPERHRDPSYFFKPCRGEFHKYLSEILLPVRVIQKNVELARALPDHWLRVPRMFLQYRGPLLFGQWVQHFLGNVNSGCGNPRRWPLVHLRVNEGHFGQVIGEEVLSFAAPGHFYETVEEEEDRWAIYIESELLEEKSLQVHDLFLRVGEVGDFAEIVQLGRVYLFVF